ncbi:MAG: enoyl-CoA hydratase/isomerase family protein [Chloroflexi bacterium]|nr:enoyl-CoA hydratase/isomerase family protein [Chloroflexota bacterium]
MTDELVHLDIAGGVGTITLDSPANRNALSRQLFADLFRHVNAAMADDRVHVVVLTGTGTVFCSGADLKEQREANVSGSGQTGPGGLVEIVMALWNSPKPVVGRINGHARAGGLGLMAACDIAIAVDTATFAFSEVRIGVAPAIIAVVTLPKMGLTNGLELMLTGDTIDAARAVQVGLLNAAAAPAEFEAVVGRYTESLLKGGPNALAETKRLVREVPGLATDVAFARMAKLSGVLFASLEAREGMTAFAEKRPPSWAVTE